jgi:hypothetical protein
MPAFLYDCVETVSRETAKTSLIHALCAFAPVPNRSAGAHAIQSAVGTNVGVRVTSPRAFRGMAGVYAREYGTLPRIHGLAAVPLGRQGSARRR